MAVEFFQELVDGAGRLHVGVEVIGLGEQVAFQPLCPGFIGLRNEAVVEVVIFGGRHQVFVAADAAALQQDKHLMHGHAFDQRDVYRHGRTGIGPHVLYQRTIVIGGLQLVFSRPHLGVGMCDFAVHFKQPAILDQTCLLQGIAEILDIRMADRFLSGHHAVFILDVDNFALEDTLRQHDRRGKALLVEGQHIAGRHPGQAGQHDAYTQNKHRKQNPAEAAGPGFFAPSDRMVALLWKLLFLCCLLIRPLLLLGVQQLSRFHMDLAETLRPGARLHLIFMDLKNLVDFLAVLRHGFTSRRGMLCVQHSAFHINL